MVFIQEWNEKKSEIFRYINVHIKEIPHKKSQCQYRTGENGDSDESQN